MQNFLILEHQNKLQDGLSWCFWSIRNFSTFVKLIPFDTMTAEEVKQEVVFDLRNRNLKRRDAGALPRRVTSQRFRPAACMIALGMTWSSL